MFLEQLAETVGLFDLRKRNLPGRVWPTETDGRREEMRRWREKEEEVRKRKEEGEKEEEGEKIRQIENRIKELESSISGEKEEGGGGGGEAALGAASVEGEGEGEKSITNQSQVNMETIQGQNVMAESSRPFVFRI